MMNSEKVGVRNVRFGVGIVTRTTPGPCESLQSSHIEELFRGWFNNHMTVILMAIEHVRPKETLVKIKMNLFLADIEHHYIRSNAPQGLRRAFRYLGLFFKVHPAVKPLQCRRAFAMVQRIYEGVGLTLEVQKS